MDNLMKWLFEQLGMVVVLGVSVFWLAKKLIKTEEEKDKLSEKVIELATKWEIEAKNLSEGDKDFKKEDREFKNEVIATLNEIKGNLK